LAPGAPGIRLYAPANLFMPLPGTDGTAALLAKCVEKYSSAKSDRAKKIKYREKHGQILEQFYSVLKSRSNPGEVYIIFGPLGELSFFGVNYRHFFSC